MAAEFVGGIMDIGKSKEHLAARAAYYSGDKNASRNVSTKSVAGGPGGHYNKTTVDYALAAPEPAPQAPSKVAAPAPQVQAVPKTVLEPPKPIEYSPEIQQAKERVQSYQADALSGKTSEEIYGGKPGQAGYLNKYELNLNA